MTTPAKTAPSSPLDKMMISAVCRDVRFVPRLEKDIPGFLKYSISFVSLTMMMKTIGNKKTMIHEERKSIFSKKPIPKNNMKNKSIEIIKTGNGMLFLTLLKSDTFSLLKK